MPATPTSTRYRRRVVSLASPSAACGRCRPHTAPRPHRLHRLRRHSPDGGLHRRRGRAQRARRHSRERRLAPDRLARRTGGFEGRQRGRHAGAGLGHAPARRPAATCLACSTCTAARTPSTATPSSTSSRSTPARATRLLYGNPRGSQGYGEAFTTRGRAATGAAATAADVTAPRRRPSAAATVIDPERLGIMGGSYGGFMTSWIVGHSNRFRAACSERAVNNQHSMFGTSDIGSCSTSSSSAGRRRGTTSAATSSVRR